MADITYERADELYNMYNDSFCKIVDEIDTITRMRLENPETAVRMYGPEISNVIVSSREHHHENKHVSVAILRELRMMISEMKGSEILEFIDKIHPMYLRYALLAPVYEYWHGSIAFGCAYAGMWDVGKVLNEKANAIVNTAPTDYYDRTFDKVCENTKKVYEIRTMGCPMKAKE